MSKWMLAIIGFFVLIPASWALVICDGKPVLGRTEQIIITAKEIPLNAKLDTGADMSSLSAQHIELLESQHQTWVRFQLPETEKKNYILTAPLIRMARILKRKDEQSDKIYSERPVIKLEVCLGGRRLITLVNLIDRSDFKYPLLLGRNTLKQFHVVVDVSQDHLAAVDQCTVNHGL